MHKQLNRRVPWDAYVEKQCGTIVLNLRIHIRKPNHPHSTMSPKSTQQILQKALSNVNANL